jgi:hypothetical protein
MTVCRAVIARAACEHNDLVRVFAKTFPKPSQLAAVAVHELIVEDHRRLQVRGNSQTNQCRQLFACPD